MFDEYEPWQGEIPGGPPARWSPRLPVGPPPTPSSISSARGTIFVAPGEQVYEGMIVGENSRSNDLVVNITKEKKAVRRRRPPWWPVSRVRIDSPRSMSLEQALEFIREDELVEVTPQDPFDCASTGAQERAARA